MATHYDAFDPARLRAQLHVRALTMLEWFDLLQRQIERAQKLDPDPAAELTAILEGMRSPHLLPGDMTGSLGVAALAAKSLAESTANRDNASKQKKRVVALATFQVWCGTSMTPEKRDECERYVAHELNSDRRTVTDWFNDLINHPDSY
ncbi:hypothetical protein [Paraburkholderia unamae]|uniref:Uncharacterized protein n=1 Tax=Paraburkholderia unamae TaxID=219649 RepID=A0ABX5K5U4_9BURK|nr:hypothetical protein [Paraburkholderia unamae]PVX59452.1 hypothetical protein C7402_1593 [Paraburkholderia unamae]CAG9249724.1 hypothetical protein PUN4_1450008 [Paraburkholderia unamae]